MAEHIDVLPLHSTLTADEQQLVFKPPTPGKIKVIVSTNIAESSVTISDAVVVVDAGKVKELTYDSRRRMSTLETRLASQASATQRKGRTGRVAPGKCYRLYSRPMLEVMPGNLSLWFPLKLVLVPCYAHPRTLTFVHAYFSLQLVSCRR